MQDSSLRENIKISVIIIAAIIAVIIMFVFAPKKGDVVVINCTWSEISPDFTPQMKEACRQARTKNYQENLQKPK